MTDRLPYFRTADRIQMLLDQLYLWRGTRWAHAGVRPNEMRCGVSGDCLFWVHVFKAIGALPANIEVPEYQSQEALAAKMQTLRSRIEATGRAQEIVGRRFAEDGVSSDSASPPHDTAGKMPALQPGDVLLFHNGMSGAHCGLVVKVFPTHFVHLSRNGLLEEPLNQSHWLDNLAFVYRLLEENGSNPDKNVGLNVERPTSDVQHRTGADLDVESSTLNVGRLPCSERGEGVSPP